VTEGSLLSVDVEGGELAVRIEAPAAKNDAPTVPATA
jgi:hypothetical protein